MNERQRAEARMFYLEEQIGFLTRDERNADAAVALCEIGKLYLGPLEEKDHARQSFLHALSFDPNNPEAAQLLKEHFPGRQESARPFVVLATDCYLPRRGPDTGPDSSPDPSPRNPNPDHPQAGNSSRLPDDRL